MIASSECSHLTMVLNVGVPPRLFLISVHKACLDCCSALVSSLLHPPVPLQLCSPTPSGIHGGIQIYSDLLFPFSQTGTSQLGFFGQFCLPSSAGRSDRAHPKRSPQSHWVKHTALSSVKTGPERESDAVGYNHHLKWNSTNLAHFGFSSDLNYLTFHGGCPLPGLVLRIFFASRVSFLFILTCLVFVFQAHTVLF